ncbi:50S ribosomal protein L31 [Candidatus Trichorickettsia mobilis]|uniref:50S ribosomal protein L31 n=1 Tax=Candidatus Trichorickettsia mobilis TaxID=1346319 RepID=UPI0029311F31|nr:50S ribosomal protein L31 [Candidatus Trichorickettsia mobilis]
MKLGIHPAYKKLRIKIGEDLFETNSTLGVEEILMDVDYRKHPAWTKDGLNVINESNQSISNFNKKFGGLKFGAK